MLRRGVVPHAVSRCGTLVGDEGPHERCLTGVDQALFRHFDLHRLVQDAVPIPLQRKQPAEERGRVDRFRLVRGPKMEILPFRAARGIGDPQVDVHFQLSIRTVRGSESDLLPAPFRVAIEESIVDTRVLPRPATRRQRIGGDRTARSPTPSAPSGPAASRGCRPALRRRWRTTVRWPERYRRTDPAETRRTQRTRDHPVAPAPCRPADRDGCRGSPVHSLPDSGSPAARSPGDGPPPCGSSPVPRWDRAITAISIARMRKRPLVRC